MENPTQTPAQQTSQVQEQEASTKKPGSSKKLILKIAIGCGIVLLLASLCIGGYFVYKYVTQKDGKGEGSNQESEQAESSEADDGESSSDTTDDLQISKYDKDTDRDGIPDVVEIGTGYDPYKNECALEAGCGDVSGVKKPTFNVLLILDSSGSMRDPIEGRQKIDIAKEALNKYLDKVPEDTNVGFMVYGHKGGPTDQGKIESCQDPEILIPIQPTSQTKERIKQIANSFQPQGWTPIAKAIEVAQGAFQGMEGETNKIILLSDGEETCEGDPCPAAQEAKKQGIDPIIDTVGFDVNNAAAQQLECIAQVTGGEYYYAQTGDELIQYFNQKGEQAQQLAEASGCLSLNLANYVGCLSVRFVEAVNYLTDECLKEIELGNSCSEINEAKEKISDMYLSLTGTAVEEYEEETEDIWEDYNE